MVSVCLCAGPGALAQDAQEQSSQDPKAEALRLYKIGYLQYEGEEYAKAAATFAAAYELDKNAVLAYNAAQAFENSGDTERARAFYEAQLGLEDEGDLAKRARQALERIAVLEAERKAREQEAARKTGTVEVRTEGGGEVFIDGKLAGSTPGRFELDPGEYTLEVRRAGSKPDVRTIEISAGRVLPLMVLLEPEEKKLDVVGLSGFGMMGGGVLVGAVGLVLNEPKPKGRLSTGASSLVVSAVALELTGAGLLLWSLFDQEPAPSDTPDTLTRNLP